MTNNDRDPKLLNPSNFTNVLIEVIDSIEHEKRKTTGEIIEVSEAASFFAVAYEKLRSIIEFNDERLIRHASIDRILKRRLSVNITGNGEGLNLARELLWSRQVRAGELSEGHADEMQKIIDSFLKLNSHAKQNWPTSFSHVVSLLACEIEEYLEPEIRQKEQAFLFFLFQTIHDTLHIENVDDSQKDLYLFLACEENLYKSNTTFLQYHLLIQKWGTIANLNADELKRLGMELKQLSKNYKQAIENKYRDKLTRFVRRQLPAYRILFELFTSTDEIASTINNQDKLQKRINEICISKYEETKDKLRIAGVRSVIYIFATKMIFVLLLEVPLTSFFYSQFHLLPVILNTLMPPVLMGIIVLTVRAPSTQNTEQLYRKIVSIITYDPTDSGSRTVISDKAHERRPFLKSVFYMLYAFLFATVFFIIYGMLDLLEFNLINKTIFFLFVCLITFFGYRVRQISKEYSLSLQDHLWTPIVDTFFLPFMSVGKVLSAQVARLNVLMFIFDVLIEAPLKLIIELVEEWRDFTKQKKEELM